MRTRTRAQHRTIQTAGLVIVSIFSMLLIGVVVSRVFVLRPTRKTETYFSGTDHEVRVYTSAGRVPRPVLLIIGGIHGDEMAPCLTAERYAGIEMHEGKLIVVPRLNLPAVLEGKRTGVSGDMNRMFHLPEETTGNPDMKVVDLARRLIGEADCVLNLHQGSGFYSPVWIDSLRNPFRWGQSNVIDTPVFDLPTGRRLELQTFAEKVVNRINAEIADPQYHFHVNNTNTASEDSAHKEQRKSLTYFALTRRHKMALGVEATKHATLPQAVEFLTLAVNATIEEMNILPCRLPTADSTVISEEIRQRQKPGGLLVIHRGMERRIPSGETLMVARGDAVEIRAVDAPQETGWYASFAGDTRFNGTGTRILADRDTTIIIRGGGTRRSSISIRASLCSMEHLAIEINGRQQSAANGSTIQLPADGTLKILGILPDPKDPDIRVNLKGFLPPGPVNNGHDIGYPIHPSDMIRRYAEDGRGTRYPIEVTCRGRAVGRLDLEIVEPAPGAPGG